MDRAHRERFDALLGDAIGALPPRFRRVIDEVPVIVLDRADRTLLQQLRRDDVLPDGEDDLMGLHSGVAITERSHADTGDLPAQIHVFRDGIVEHAGGWSQEHADQEVYEEIRVTLLHEIGHHFGLDEDDLEQLGYG